MILEDAIIVFVQTPTESRFAKINVIMMSSAQPLLPVTFPSLQGIVAPIYQVSKLNSSSK